MHDDMNIIERILQPIGRNVSFKYPADEPQCQGILKDPAVIPSNPSQGGVPY